MFMVYIVIELFTLNTVYRVLVGYPPALPEDTAYDDRQVSYHHQQVDCRIKRYLFGKLIHP